MECTKQDRLDRNFPRLNHENQAYILGLAEGLREAGARRETAVPPAEVHGERKPLLNRKGLYAERER